MPPSPPWNLPSLWSPPFPLHALALISLSLAKVQFLLTLTLSPFHDLVLWTDGPFPFDKGSSDILANGSLCALRPLFPFQQAQYVEVFPLKPVTFCMLFVGLDSTIKSAISLLFSYLTLDLSSLPCPLLHLLFQSLWHMWQELFSLTVLSGYNGSLDTPFSPGTTQLTSWPGRECYLHPVQFLVVSLLSLISTLVFSRTGGILSHQNSLAHRFLQFSLRNLCFLLMLAVFSLIYAAMDTAFC